MVTVCRVMDFMMYFNLLALYVLDCEMRIETRLFASSYPQYCKVMYKGKVGYHE